MNLISGLANSQDMWLYYTTPSSYPFFAEKAPNFEWIKSLSVDGSAVLAIIILLYALFSLVGVCIFIKMVVEDKKNYQ